MKNKIIYLVFISSIGLIILYQFNENRKWLRANAIGVQKCAGLLDQAEAYLDNPENGNWNIVPNVAVTMYDLSEISSEGRAGFFGYESITRNDLVKWRAWLSQNEQSIYWDSDSEQILLRSE